MLGNWPPEDFPNLNNSNHNITSSPTKTYNCIAWAAGDDNRWWWPHPQLIILGEVYWPPTAPCECNIKSFIAAFNIYGYFQCLNGLFESGYEKIAIYTKSDPSGNVIPTHAARQLSDGTWTSKLGECEDINHMKDIDLNGPRYGAVYCYLKRPQAPQNLRNSSTT
jgi:hypothetical protein